VPTPTVCHLSVDVALVGGGAIIREMHDTTGTRRPRMLPIIGAMVGLSVLVGACAAGSPPEVANGDPVLQEGRTLYQTQCMSCHGTSGGGGRGPKLAGGTLLADFPSQAEQVALVAGGRNAMPAFGGRLDASQIEAVVRYTREVLAVQP
jgi:mono/diheme cytochrome c family protein